VTLCDSYRLAASEQESLVRLRKELGLDAYWCTTLLDNNEY
jgi:hypothetical protein